MKIYLATWLLEKSQGDSLTRIKAHKRLMSFYHSKDKGGKEFKGYVKTGKNS